MSEKDQKITMAVFSLVFGILGLISVCIVVGFPLSIIGLVLGIIVLVKKKGGKEIAIAGIILSAIGFLLFFVLLTGASHTSTDVASETEKVTTAETTAEKTTITEEMTTQEETTIQEETTTEPETEETTTEEETTVTETESEDEFKSSCQEIGYKKLLRTPDDYVGQRIVITAEVQQIIDGGLFDDSKYYRVQTDNNDSGYYFDDEYFMYDNRVSDDMKILDGDVLKIYGEFTGLETMKRVITGSKDEVPAIKAYYIELISE